MRQALRRPAVSILAAFPVSVINYRDSAGVSVTKRIILLLIVVTNVGGERELCLRDGHILNDKRK